MKLALYHLKAIVYEVMLFVFYSACFTSYSWAADTGEIIGINSTDGSLLASKHIKKRIAA
ncbi:MAG: hypothetical protein GY699_04160 [Desulfobacteraceae bacterium]|nr:hypothetical protein [Desulfobacteraceae bacterium]